MVTIKEGYVMNAREKPWKGVSPTSSKNVANSLNSDYAIARTDHLFQLFREANGLKIDPK